MRYSVTRMKKIQKIIILTSVGISAFVLATPPQTFAADLKCNILPQSICNKADDSGSVENTGIWALLLFVLNILTALVGFVAVGMIGYAGFLYATAGEKADQVKKSKDMIQNVLIGLVLYGLMYVLLNWLVPGGVFA